MVATNTPAVLHLILNDLLFSTGKSIEAVDPKGAEDAFGNTAWFRGWSGSRIGMPLDGYVSDDERDLLLAEQMQGFIQEELPGVGRSSAWPNCPAHPGTHPLVPSNHAKPLSWVCPHTKATVVAVGSLKPFTGESAADL